jgi:hypothetical protein
MTASDSELSLISSNAVTAARQNSLHWTARVALLIPAGIFKDIVFNKGDKPLAGGVSTQPGMSTLVSIPNPVNWSANRRTAYATPPRVKNGSNSHETMVTDFTTYLSSKMMGRSPK